jgi:hypothetical protein
MVRRRVKGYILVMDKGQKQKRVGLKGQRKFSADGNSISLCGLMMPAEEH